MPRLCVGRKKVPLARMAGETKRMVTFSKRKDGIFKKASELSVLCGAEIAVILSSPKNVYHSFGSPSVDAVLNRYIRPPSKPVQPDVTVDGIANLNNQLTEVNQIWNDIETKKKEAEKLDMSMKNREKDWFESPLEELNLEQLDLLVRALEDLRDDIDEFQLQRKNNQQSNFASSSHGALPTNGGWNENVMQFQQPNPGLSELNVNNTTFQFANSGQGTPHFPVPTAYNHQFGVASTSYGAQSSNPWVGASFTDKNPSLLAHTGQGAEQLVGRATNNHPRIDVPVQTAYNPPFEVGSTSCGAQPSNRWNEGTLTGLIPSLLAHHRQGPEKLLVSTTNNPPIDGSVGPTSFGGYPTNQRGNGTLADVISSLVVHPGQGTGQLPGTAINNPRIDVTTATNPPFDPSIGGRLNQQNLVLFQLASFGQGTQQQPLVPSESNPHFNAPSTSYRASPFDLWTADESSEDRNPVQFPYSGNPFGTL